MIVGSALVYFGSDWSQAAMRQAIDRLPLRIQAGMRSLKTVTELSVKEGQEI